MIKLKPKNEINLVKIKRFLLLRQILRMKITSLRCLPILYSIFLTNFNLYTTINLL